MDATPKCTQKKFELTAQQREFVRELVEGDGNVALVARAGCGKTSTILAGVGEYAKRFPDREVTVCAYGKAVQREVEAKLQAMGLCNWRQVQAATSHSMGFGLVRHVFKPRVDDAKVREIVRAQNDPTCGEYGSQVRDLVHLAKTEGFGFFDDCQVGDSGAWYRLADHYNVNGFDDTTATDRVVEAAQRVYRLSLDQVDVVDFDDMVLFPLVKNLRVRFQRDLVVVDEAQDTSRARRALLRKFVRPGGRMVVVGDDRQAIMGFAGASADALSDLVRELRPAVLPLTVTWRCPKAVVRLAQELVPDIEAAAAAPEGEILRLESLPDELLPTDAVLCRNTAPLVETAYRLIRRGVACKVEGREIGTGLLRLVDRWKRAKTIGTFLDLLEAHREREVQKATAKGKEQKAQEVGDRCDTVVAVCQAVRARGREDLDGVREFIRDLFADDVTGVLTLCTYHRSKGREWPRVMLLEHERRCPSPWAKREWELRQEANLAYVAITRAQQTLAFVS